MVTGKFVEQRLQRMRVWMELRGLQPIMVSVYLRCARLFIEQVKKSLRAVKQANIEQ